LDFAKQLITRHLVTGFPEQRLAYLSDAIQAASAHYCAVLRPNEFTLLGLVKFSDVVAIPSLGARIFSDLMGPPPRYVVYDVDPVEKVYDLLGNNPSEIVVTRGSGEFTGLITPESFFRWLLGKTLPDGLGLEKNLRGTPWSPYADDPTKRKEASISPQVSSRPTPPAAIPFPFPKAAS
jgi:hypothetical protein